MDRLELNVDEPSLDEVRHLRPVLVHEGFERSENRVELRHGRRDEERVARTATSNPILRTPELAWVLGAAATAAKKPSVHLPDEPQRERQLVEPLQPEHHRIDVVGDLANVVDRLAGLRVGFEAEQVGERGLGAFDLRGEHRLLADVHVEEQVLPRQEHGDAVEPTERAFRDAQAIQKRQDVDRWLGRQRRRHEGANDFAGDGRLDEAAEPRGSDRALGLRSMMMPSFYQSKPALA